MDELSKTVSVITPKGDSAPTLSSDTSSVAYWAATAIEFSKQPLLDRQVVRAADGGFTFQTKALVSDS